MMAKISNWVHIETVDDNDPPLILENTVKPDGEDSELWREATDEEYGRYVDYYNELWKEDE